MTPRRPRWRRRIAFVVATGVFLWLGHSWLLKSVASILVYEPPHSSAQVIMLLDGDRRYDVVAELHRQGATKVVAFTGPPSRLERMGILRPEREIIQRELALRGIPQPDLEIIAGNSTAKKAIAADFARWLEGRPDLSAYVVCDRFGSRSWRSDFTKSADAKLLNRLQFVPITNRNFDESNWWRTKPGVQGFLNSWIGLCYSWFGPPNPPTSAERRAEDFRAAFMREATP